MSQAPTGSYSCRWCRASFDATATTTCPSCGAPVDVQTMVSDSGWFELPAIKDMARLQIGRSHVQIEGKYVPVADFNLAEGDNVYFAHHVLLWKDSSVQFRAMSLGGAWNRLFSGMPLIMTEAHGPGHIAFSRDAPGELVALPLQPGQSVDVREHVFLAATGTATYSWFQSGIWFTTRSGDDTETHYPCGMYMDRFTSQQAPGLALIHAGGNAFVRGLGAGETMLIKPPALLFKDSTVQMQLHIEQPGGTGWTPWRAWANRYVWLRMFGPGRVAVQSAYEHFHDPGTTLSSSSPATWSQW